MKKNWKTTVSVLLLAALLCALPGALAWGEGGTDVGAIVPDGPAGNQTGGEDGGTGSGSTTETGGTTTETNTSGTTDNQGDSGSGSL